MSLQCMHNKVCEILNRLIQLEGELGNLYATLQHIADVAKEVFEADICTIVALNPMTRNFIEPLTVAGETFTSLPYENSVSSNITNHVLKSGFVCIENLEVCPEYQSFFTQKEQICSFAALPLYAKRQPNHLGILSLNFRHQKHFTSEDEELLRVFADQASFILQTTWKEYYYEEVARIGQNINHNLSTVEDLFQELQIYIQNVLDESHTLLFAVYHQQTDTIDFYRKEPGCRIMTTAGPMRGACEYVINTQESICIKQFSLERECIPYQIIRVQDTELKESLIFVPVTLRGISLGVLSIQHASPNSYDENDLFMFKLLAIHTGLALHNMRLYNSLDQLNKAGRLLTQQPDSEQALSTTAQNILNATRTDIIVLYQYDSRLQQFILPPIVAGTIHEASANSMALSQPLLAELVLHNDRTIFAEDSIDAYKQSQAAIEHDNFQQREQIASVAAIPLKDRDEPVGVLFVNYHRSQDFDSTQKLLIEGLASFAATAIRNAQAYGSLNLRRATELAILQNIGRELSRILELEPILDTILQAANKLIKAERATIMLYKPQNALLKTAALAGRYVDEGPRVTIDMQDARGITAWVLKNKHPALVNNVNDPKWQGIYFPSRNDIVSELDVPLLDEEEVIGVLNFESTREGAFSEEDMGFLLNLAGQTVLAIKNAQSYERERRLADERRILNEISKEITRQFDPIEVFNLILDKALQFTYGAYGTLWLYDPDQNDLWMAAERGIGGERTERMSLNQGIVGYVAREKQSVNIDPTESPWNQIYLPFLSSTRSELAVAMLARDDLRGVLNIESALPNNFDEGYQRLMIGLSDLAVIALQNAERYQETQREARRYELLYQIEPQLGKLKELAQVQTAYDIIIGIVAKSEQCYVNIYRYSEATQQLTSINASPYLEDPFLQVNIDEAIHQQVMQERRMITIYDAAAHVAGITYTKRETVTRHSLVIAPIIFSDKYYGNLEVSHENVGHLRATNIYFLERLTQQLASTIANTIYRLEIAEERQESERRALSAEEMSSIGQLAYELTHRVGNDLGLVEFYIDDIREELETAKLKNSFIMGKLGKIVRSARRVLDLSRELKYEMIKTGNALADTPTEVQPKSLFDDVIDEFKDRLAQRPDIQIEINNAHDAGSVRILRSSILDLLHNIILNALEAMPNGGKLTLHAYTNGACVALAVSDTGVGIPPEKQSKVFELSFSTKGSSGFGLWSALRNARRNSGTLSVTSKKGQGTTFILLLPKISGEAIQAL